MSPESIFQKTRLRDPEGDVTSVSARRSLASLPFLFATPRWLISLPSASWPRWPLDLMVSARPLEIHRKSPAPESSPGDNRAAAAVLFMLQRHPVSLRFAMFQGHLGVNVA